jgi:DNA modification methylase/transcriptional regulator with XRE-family HTH domain/DNA-directed RNA polymerase subunit RPC12/RpoP
MSYLFGARLQELRQQAGMTLRDLADVFEVDHTYLSHIECGRRSPREALVRRVAEHFGEDPEILAIQAGLVPERILTLMQRKPQLTLSLLDSLDSEEMARHTTWYKSPKDVFAAGASQSDQIDALDDYVRLPFAQNVDAGKNTPIYNAHSYHTKVPYQGIIPYIEHYTRPGDLVLDPFAGSGMTGVAAILSGRRAILNDISPAAVHIARNYTTPCDPKALRAAYSRLVPTLEHLSDELYGTTCDSCGGPALIEYTIFSDVFQCVNCSSEMDLWNHGRGADGKLTGHIECPSCGSEYNKNALKWLRAQPCRVSTSCSGACKGRHERLPSPRDLEHLERIAALSPSGWTPDVQFGPEWEMWRQGHADRGITTVRDFFTPRNLHALSSVHQLVTAEEDSRISAALLFAFTGCVNRASKRYQWNHKRPTNVLSGTLYVSSLFYEFNVYRLFERKVQAALKMFAATFTAEGQAAVTCGSATELNDIPDASVDYVFTDPPFGSNIYYSDCSLLWESWLGTLTDRDREIVITRSRSVAEGGRDLAAYQELLTQALGEIRRVLKPNRWASVVFHNSSSAVWDAVRNACVDAGFTLGTALMFDKRQKSFKGIKGIQEGESIANFDVVLNLQRRAPLLIDVESASTSEARIVEGIRIHLAKTPASEDEKRSTPYLHSLAIQQAWGEHLDLAAIDYKQFERLLEREFTSVSGVWAVANPEVTALKTAIASNLGEGRS